MTQAQDNIFCGAFLDRLEAWLAGEYDAEHMQAHYDSCEGCRREAQLAREIGSIVATLPQLAGPELRVYAADHAHADQPLFARLLGAWRQPLVLVPAFALALAAVVAVQWHRPERTAVDPDLVIIDGTAYTREEIQQAAADLETALRYLDKYGAYPAQVISAELENSRLPLPEPQEASEPVPTI